MVGRLVNVRVRRKGGRRKAEGEDEDEDEELMTGWPVGLIWAVYLVVREHFRRH